MTSARRLALVPIALALTVQAAHADPASCQAQLARQLLKYEKVFVKQLAKCLDQENLQRIPGPCPDARAVAKIDSLTLKVSGKIANACTMSDFAALGFPSDCALATSSGDATAACASLPVSTVDEAIACVRCWKTAGLAAYAATLYASHANELCGTVDASSDVCTPLGCTAPLPDQRTLTDGNEVTCQRGIGKGGVKYLVLRAKALIGCALAGGTQSSCLVDTVVQQKLAAAEAKKTATIKKKCGNQDPEPSPSFCCRTTGNTCIAAATREDCVTGGGDVQENKVCDVDFTCATLGGGHQMTWWGSCPTSAPCPGTALGTTDDLVGCVDAVADATLDQLLCLQFRGNGGADWPCPGSPSGAFLD